MGLARGWADLGSDRMLLMGDRESSLWGPGNPAMAPKFISTCTCSCVKIFERECVGTLRESEWGF